MEDTEVKVVMTADGSQLVQTFDQLVNQITQTREELRQYRDDKEKTAELTQKLADEEQQLVQLMAKNNNVIDASNVSYKQLNDILKDLNKTYKNTSDAAQRMNIAPASKALNQELKTMDANIGNYQRNVGNYANDVEKAFNNVRLQTSQVLRELPTLKNGFEMFFLAISNNLPMFVDAIKSYNDLQKARKASAANATTDAVAHRAEATETTESTLAHEGEAKAVSASAAAHLKEAENALKDAQAKQLLAKEAVIEKKNLVDSLTMRQQNVDAQLLELKTQNQMAEMDIQHIGRMSQVNQLKRQRAELDMQLTTATYEYEAAQEKLAAADMKVAAAEKAVNDQRNAQTAGGALKAIIKVLFSWETALLAGIMILTLYGKEIINWVKGLNLFTSEAKKAAKFQKEWNQYMKEGHQNAAKQLVDLQIYSKWATMASKNDKERTIAAKEVLKTMGSATTATNIAKVKNGEFAKSIEEVTEALVKQAQAEAMAAKITEKYKDVIDAMDNKAEAMRKQAEGELSGWEKFQKDFAKMGLYQSAEGGFTTVPNNIDQTLQDDILKRNVEKADANLAKVQDNFDKWLNKFLEEFNPSELLFGKDGGAGGKGDKWFSKWELYIKGYEATLKKFQGEYEEFDFASIWKYSAEGLEYYTKMYDEYIEHYKGEEKEHKEAQINKAKYEKEYNEYHTKLQQQYLDSLKTEQKIELDKLEEWHTVQVEIYKNAGEETTGLEAEYAKRKQDILDRYIDKYKNAMMEKEAVDAAASSGIAAYNKAMMELELQNLQDAMDKEIKEYERKGIETTNLEEHYEQERNKIYSKYAKQRADYAIAQIQREEDESMRRNRLETSNAMLLGKNGTVQGERIWGSMGSTAVWGIGRNRAELQGLEQEKKIYEDSANAQIAEMQRVLASSELIGEERLEMETALANAQKELQLGVLEYEMEINQMRVDNAKSAFDEISGYLQQSFQGISGIFDDVYSAYETMTDTQVKQGKISQEEAEKQLENYRGIKAASAAFDAFGSAVAAYQSLAGIPVVGPGLGALAAAAALAAGMAQVKNIMATTKNSIPNGTDSYANAMPKMTDIVPSYVVNLTHKSDTDYLRNALTEKPIQAYVVESSITAAQELANTRERETTF